MPEDCRSCCLCPLGACSFRPSLLAGFQSPDDFVVRNQTLKYTNGDTYEVRDGPPPPPRCTAPPPSGPAEPHALCPCVHGQAAAFHCHGVGTFPNLRLLCAQGETLGSLRHGRGVHTCSSGDVYEGQWRCVKGLGLRGFRAGLGWG